MLKISSLLLPFLSTCVYHSKHLLLLSTFTTDFCQLLFTFLHFLNVFLIFTILILFFITFTTFSHCPTFHYFWTLFTAFEHFSLLLNTLYHYSILVFIYTIFMWIGANNGMMWFPVSFGNDFEQCSTCSNLNCVNCD